MNLTTWLPLGLGLLLIPPVAAVLTYRLLRRPVWAWQAFLVRGLAGVTGFLGVGAVVTIVLSLASGLPEVVGGVVAIAMGVLVAGSVCLTARGLRDPAPAVVTPPDEPAGA
ncbi:hypothetical protein [Actinomycetospora termitidis]|uniref:Uncharacterized protein n=1 Tax=Actinomycetospora termitidis TaxID=3053470 RepID=A0ABT7MF10_9PSEU|nr:hypothetical protein [Actinomycetospora sp. Odt1-22]MDL5159255.1 hypothetical protein [Actinomycetospora sp. Odt1-22]